MADFDLAVIGGGVNGVGIARDAAGRGVSVLLLEQRDLASGTSSASTKLIHGGLRYLEQYAFGLVRKALREREILLHLAPHILAPKRFVLPHAEGMRPYWMLRLGLFLYDRLAGRTALPGARAIDLAADPLGVVLKRTIRRAFEYSDCWVDDSRLVVLNAVDAAERGAVIRTRARLVRAERAEGAWRLVINARGRREVLTARVLVNASGPWVAEVAQSVLRMPSPPGLRLVKGSHIIVPRLAETDRAYIFQNVDRRVVFAIPYQQDFTLIGTTDQDYDGDPAAAVTTPAEIVYLCAAVTRYLRTPITPHDVLHAYSGVRPLYGEGGASELTRDYTLELDAPTGAPPLLTVHGGKITTYRRLAEEAMALVAPFFAARGPWTAGAPLPGGDFAPEGFDDLLEQTCERWPFLTRSHARRMLRAYGTRIDDVLRRARSLDDLGPGFGADLTAAEVRYMMQQEWAETAEDVLWRRSKLGLRLDASEQQALAAFMEQEARAGA